MMQLKTIIFYADYHPDLRTRETDPIHHCHVYPTYDIPGLEVVRVGRLGKGDIELDLFPKSFNEQFLSKNQKENERVKLEKLVKRAKLDHDIVHWHIDPDIFTGSPKLPNYFLNSAILCEAPSTGEDPNLYFDLIRETKPDFVGFFEFYLSYLGCCFKNPKGQLSKVLANLIQKTLPNAAFVLIDSQVLERNSHLTSLLNKGAKIIPYEMEEPYRTDASKGIAIKSNGTEICFNELVRRGAVVGFFESHKDALATFDYRT